MNANELSSSPPPLAYSAPEHLVRDLASRGMVVLPPESLGIPAEIHDRIHRREKQAVAAGEHVTPELVAEVLEVISAPGVVAACNQLAGENWAIVPFTHNATFASGARDQHWHKDDNGPYNGRKQRHHQAVQIEMLYYPQEVRVDMGPTATLPYSQYWTFNHEENHDNFAGSDHLDFRYQISGMEGQVVSGPDSPYDTGDVVHRRTAHDVRMQEAVTNLGWPLLQPFEAAPLRAGSIVLYSHNMFHRGNHRRDDWRTWEDNPRFMWRFWVYRTTAPAGGDGAPQEVDWNGLGVDPLTSIDRSAAGGDVTAVWRYHNHWMRTGGTPPPSAPSPPPCPPRTGKRRPAACSAGCSPRARRRSPPASAPPTGWLPSAILPWRCGCSARPSTSSGRVLGGRPPMGWWPSVRRPPQPFSRRWNQRLNGYARRGCTAWEKSVPSPTRFCRRS